MTDYIKRENAFYSGLAAKINEIPSEDVAPVRHGKWEEREADAEHWQSAKCSVCGLYHTTPYIYSFKDYNYCPNCGAKMDEGEEKA